MSIETIFMNTENNKKNETHTIFFNLSQKLDLGVQINMLLFETYLFITRVKIRENNKLKIRAPTWNDEFELPNGSYSVSDIQDYI